MAGLIDRYLAGLTEQLAFDPGLAARVREEVAGHLEDALDADPEGQGEAAERRVLARFGDASKIARDFAEAALGRRLRSAWRWAALAVAAVFLAMRARNLLLSADYPDGVATVDLALFVDRYAFVAAIAVGLLGWLSIRSRRGAARARGALAPLAVGTLALAASTASGITIVAMCPEVGIVPPLTILLELAAIGLLVSRLAVLRHHVAELVPSL